MVHTPERWKDAEQEHAGRRDVSAPDELDQARLFLRRFNKDERNCNTTGDDMGCRSGRGEMRRSQSEASLDTAGHDRLFGQLYLLPAICKQST